MKFRDIKDLIIFDTETTSLDPFTGSIIEMCMMGVNRDGSYNTNSYRFAFNPNEADPKSLEINKYAERKHLWEGSQRFSAYSNEIGDLLFKKTLVAHNAFFDVNFLINSFKKTGRTRMPWRRVIDTYSIARFLYGEEADNSLDGLRDRFNISKDGNHEANKDTEDLFKIYMMMHRSIEGFIK